MSDEKEMTPIERAVGGLIADLERQLEENPYPDNLGWLETDSPQKAVIDGHVDLVALTRAVLQAIREPSDGMVAVMRDDLPLVDDPDHVGRGEYIAYWQAMIDAALEEG